MGQRKVEVTHSSILIHSNPFPAYPMWHLQSYLPSRSMQSAWWSHTWLSSKTILKGYWSARKWLHRRWWQMLETKSVGDIFEDVGDGFSRFGYQHWLSLYISEGTNIQKMSPTSRCHQNQCNPRNFLPEHSLILRGGPNFDPVKYVKEVSHVKHTKTHFWSAFKLTENLILIQFELMKMDQN